MTSRFQVSKTQIKEEPEEVSLDGGPTDDRRSSGGINISFDTENTKNGRKLTSNESRSKPVSRQNSNFSRNGLFTTQNAADQSVTPLIGAMSELDATGGAKVTIEPDGLALYEEDNAHVPKVEQLLRSLSVYSPLQPGTSTAEKQARGTAAPKMGTFVGVFLPCIQNIFGVLFFIRLAWIVGTAGLFHSLFIVLICCSVTFLTSISLSAIATNGMVPAGGPYYMISRNLGPELGGAVGILFYLGTTVAASMYILGAAEIFMLYVYPKAKIFEDSAMCYRLYGTCVLLFLSVIVMAGVKVINKFALPTVVIVNLCILLSFIGIFVKINGSDDLSYCAIGDRLANLKNWVDAHPEDFVQCDKNDLTRVFCLNDTFSASDCDDHFYRMAIENKIEKRFAIKGLMNWSFDAGSLSPKYMADSQIITEDSYKNSDDHQTDKSDENSKKLYVYTDIASSFIILVGVFFPSVTGIMAGSNRSGNLKDASRSIPLGTLAATSVSSIVYLLGTVFFAGSLDSVFMRDKFGESAFGKLIIAELAVPHPMVVCVGSLIATTGAGMQSLTGAPRLLQAIAKDGVIPLLAPLQKTDRRGEPVLAILLTIVICEMGILIAMLESITALISQFFLMCYLGVNMACALQSLLKAPSWRPRFRCYHWSLSMIGAILCIAVMFMSNWIFAIIAIVIGVVVYKYIEYRGAEKEWGDGIRGLRLSAARYALLSLEDRPLHTKNWRPQALVFCDIEPGQSTLPHEKILAFVSQLKAGKGLTVVSAVINGDFANIAEEADTAKHLLNDAKNRYKIKGFCEVLVAQEISDGRNSLIQTSGLGGLKHNTVVINWPDNWRETEEADDFVSTLRSTTAAKCAVLVVKNVDSFPDNEQKITGSIDVWWIVHDGGMMILLPFLLRQHKTWRHTHLRIFAVAQIQDNSVKMKEDLKTFLYHLRISAEVDVIEMHDQDISEYTYERTLRMMKRSEILKELGLSGKEIKSEIQTAVVDAHHKASTTVMAQPDMDLVNLSPNPTSVSFYEPDLSGTPRSEPVVQMIDDEPVSVGTESRQETPKSTGSGGPVEVGSGSVGPAVRKRSSTARQKFLGLHTFNVRRMHTAVKLNEMMRTKSHDSQLIFVNLPSPPQHGTEEYYMEFIDVLTEGLNRLVLVKGTGSEVVTIYS